MVIHCLKTYGWAYDATACGNKSFEIRLNDRGFQKGDFVELQRLHKDGTIDSGAEILRREITFVTHFKQHENWCVFGTAETKK